MDTGIGIKRTLDSIYTRPLKYVLWVSCSQGSNSEYRLVKVGNNVKPSQEA